MKELAVLVSIMAVGLWLAPAEFETKTDKRLAFFNPDEPVTPSDLLRYQRLFHVTTARTLLFEE